MTHVSVPAHTTVDDWVHIGVVATTSGGQVWDSGTNVSQGRTGTTYVDPPLRVGVDVPENLLTKHAWNYSLVPTWQSMVIRTNLLTKHVGETLSSKYT